MNTTRTREVTNNLTSNSAAVYQRSGLTSIVVSALILLVLCFFTACSHKTDSPRGSWAKGTDISWLSEMEHDGMFNQDCIEILRRQGMNAVRLRVWVNHSTGWSNIPDMLALAKRADKAGQRIMIDIHYSDFFADPSHQQIPAAWQDYSYEQLLEAVSEHTFEVLSSLKEAGVKPEWVQIGNETPNGMLWPIGKVERENGNWAQYAQLTAAGYDAAKEVFPDITVIVHVDNAYEQRDWFWQSMAEYGGKWDMIGLSHYPMMSAWNGGKTWQEMNRLAEANIRHLISDWHCPVMIAEIGTFANDATSATVMADFVQRITSIDSCAGIFYWEPEVYGGWRPAEYIPLGWGSYDMGAFTPDGQPSEVMQILLTSEPNPMKQRAYELCAFIPDHELLERSKDYMTDDFYALLDTMFYHLPEHEAMDHEWLYYFVTGNGGTIADYEVTSVEMTDGTHAVAVIKVRQKWEDGSFDENTDIEMHRLYMERVDSQWLMSDFDEHKADCIRYIANNRKEQALRSAISDYLLREIAPYYKQGELCVPTLMIVAEDDKLVYGDFWIFWYQRSADTLLTVSGGNHSGCMTLAEQDGKPIVTVFEQTEDGAGNEASAKCIFGRNYDVYQNMHSNPDVREAVRCEQLREYIRIHNISAHYYKDFGWPAVEL